MELDRLTRRLDAFTVDLAQRGVFPGHIYVGPEDYALLRHLEQQFTETYRAVRWMGPLGVSDIYEKPGQGRGQFTYDHERKRLGVNKCREDLLAGLQRYRLIGA